MIAASIEGMPPALSDCKSESESMAKQLLTPLKNYSCELLNLTGTVGKWNSFQLLQQLFAKAGM